VTAVECAAGNVLDVPPDSSAQLLKLHLELIQVVLLHGGIRSGRKPSASGILIIERRATEIKPLDRVSERGTAEVWRPYFGITQRLNGLLGIRLRFYAVLGRQPRHC
jgi:hypothetical protein